MATISMSNLGHVSMYSADDEAWQLDAALLSPSTVNAAYVESVPAHCLRCVALASVDIDGDGIPGSKYRCVIGRDSATCGCPATMAGLAAAGYCYVSGPCRECAHCRTIESKTRGICLSRCHTDACYPDERACHVGIAAAVAPDKTAPAPVSVSDVYDAASTEDERAAAILTSYPVRDEWRGAFDDLECVYQMRREIWEGLGASEGMIIRREVRLPDTLVEAAPHLLKASRMHGVTAAVPRALRNEYLTPSMWRLSFAPGAIIAAAQKDNDLRDACACLGAEKEYEGTAGQVAFDPHIAVLERLDPGTSERVTGFQFAVAGTSGVHLYGCNYDGASVDSERAHALGLQLARRLAGCSNGDVESNNAALDNLCELLRIGSDTHINAANLHMTAGGTSSVDVQAYDDRERADIYEVEEWTPLQEVEGAYVDNIYWGGAYDAGIESIARPYDSDDVSNIMGRIGLGDFESVECQHCGARIREEDAIDGEYYGVDGYFCDYDCIRGEQSDRCDAVLDDVYLIDGELYREA